MPNTVGGDRLQFTPWTTDPTLRLPAAPPAVSTIFYAAQAIGRDVNGNMVQMDDTQKAEFIGVLADFVRVQVDPIDTVSVNGLTGDKVFDVIQPVRLKAKIVAAAGGDEGRKLYWLFNNEVSYSPGVSGNFAGTVWHVPDATHVEFLPPWMIADFNGAKGMLPLAAGAATITLTKFDAGKSFNVQATVAQTIVLPPVAKLGSGDTLVFVYTGSTGRQVTIQGSGSDLVNGAATFLMGVTQYSRVTLQTDGVQWLQIG